MAHRSRLRIRLARFTVASAIATGISQLVLLTIYWTGWSEEAATASTIAFLAGSLPHFLMVRYWAWADTEPGRLRHQLTTYFTVTLVSGVASIGLTTVAEQAFLPMVSDQGWRAAMLAVSYLAASGPVFLVKFALFDRAFAQRSSQRSSQSRSQSPYAATNSARVRAANPVAPAATSS